MPDIGNVGERFISTLKSAAQEAAQDKANLALAKQEESASDMKAQLSEITNPFAGKLAMKEKDKVKTAAQRVKEAKSSDDKGDRIIPVELIKDSANQFQRRNPELKSEVLTLLRQYIKPGDSKDEILKKIREFYADPALADEALEFLLETTQGELAKQCQEARNELQQEKGREIAAGRNIGVQARAASEKGLGSPTEMRDLYRDVTGNPRDAPTMFQELSAKYPYPALKKVTDFLLHSLGTDLKAKGPSIEPGQLHRLIGETRSLQAILGVYRFFRLRMRLVNSQFARYRMEVPQELTFETMSKEFMSLVSERYPNADKIKERTQRLGIGENTTGKIVALSVMRDAMHEVPRTLFRSNQHFDDLYMANLEALEDLEEDLDEEVEQDEKVETSEPEEDVDDEIERPEA